MAVKPRVKQTEKQIVHKPIALCNKMLSDLEKGKRPYLKAVKCSLDNDIYSSKVGYLTPGEKKVTT